MNPLYLAEECFNKLPKELRLEPWKVTEHGRKILQTEDELNAYMAAYGEMHSVKCRAALQNFPFENLLHYSFEIFDWGCGQGIATLTLLDMLQERSLLSRLKKIYLIEPSSHSLNRAVNWIKQSVTSNIEIIPVNRTIPQSTNNNEMRDIYCSSQVSINLFSNILDIKQISIEWLANKTSSLANINYMTCIGPKFIQNTNTRLSDFCGYFNPSEYFSFINSFPYSYTTKTHHAYGLEAKCFVHNRNNPINNNYQECSNSYDIDPYDYAIELLYDSIDNNIVKLHNKFRQLYNSSFHLFFKPTLNCDSIDLLLASISKGIILVNICEDINDILKAYERIKKVKNNIFNLHLKKIKIDAIISPSTFNYIKTALYFPNHTLSEVNNKIQELKQEDKDNNFDFLYTFTQDYDLKEIEKINTKGFKYDYYKELIDLISSKWHFYNDGDKNFSLTEKQKEIVNDDNKRIRIKDVAGSGKTLVAVTRAVKQHLKTGEPVLIIVFNLSLIQYIRMRINQVPADFFPNMFEITNYHQFFKSKANLYTDNESSTLDFDDANFFEKHKNKIKKYKSIIIDEVQDFKPSWIQLIVKYFLAEDGSISLFGDGEQNIYEREIEEETKMPSLKGCDFPGGKWKKINKDHNNGNDRISRRILNPEITLLSSKFAHKFLSNNSPITTVNNMQFEDNYVKYWNIKSDTQPYTLARNICWIISEYHLNSEDIVVLGQSIKLLRDIEYDYVRITNQKTMINFETVQEFNQANLNSKYPKSDINKIRRTAKTHFTTSCSEIKFSTIHSFKGWEAKTVILLLQSENQFSEIDDNNYTIQEKENTPALIYTALTRAKNNLFIINFNNPTYHDFFNNNIK